MRDTKITSQDRVGHDASCRSTWDSAPRFFSKSRHPFAESCFWGHVGPPLLNLPDFLTDAEMSVTFCLQALERSKVHALVFVPFVGYELPRMMLMHGCLHFNTL